MRVGQGALREPAGWVTVLNVVEYLFFYNSMPDIYNFVAEDNNFRITTNAFYFGFERNESYSQKALGDYLEKIKHSSLGTDHLVRIGLEQTQAFVLIDDTTVDVVSHDNRFSKRSPSQYDSIAKTIDINNVDL